MDSFYKFASESPWLTFFLAMLAGHIIVASLQAIFGRKDTDN